MEELITLNQLKIYDAEKTNKLNVRFNNVYNHIDNGLNTVNNYVVNEINNVYNHIDNGLNTVNNYVVNEISNVYNYVNDIHNELNETHNNFTTLNLSVNNAQITDLNVSNVVSNSLDVNTVSINGVVGNNGQVLGVVNGKSEWMDIPDPIDADNFYVNNIYINNSAKVNNYDVMTYTVMKEDDYNHLSIYVKRSSSFLCFTQPNGNLYFKGYGYKPTTFPSYENDYYVYTNLHNLNQQITTHSLALCASEATNNFVNGSSIYSVKNDNGFVVSASIGVNTYGNILTTNAVKLFILNASYMYADCMNLTETFLCNTSLISGLMFNNYDPLDGCRNMAYMFDDCLNFNQPISIPNSVTNVDDMFNGCSNFNQPISIPNSVTILYETFSGCSKLNQPISIPNSVTNMYYTFRGCSNFNQPISIPNRVTEMTGTFRGCRNFNQPITIPNNTTGISFMLEWCSNFNQSITIPKNVTTMFNTFNGCNKLKTSSAPIHISSLIALGNTSNYIYNMLVNGGCGIAFAPSRILNDA